MASQRQDQWLFLLSITGSPGHREPVMGNYEMRGEQVISLRDVTNSLLRKARQSSQVLYFTEVGICQCLCPTGTLSTGVLLRYSCDSSITHVLCLDALLYPNLCPRELLTTEGTEARPGVPLIHIKAQNTDMGSTDDTGQCRRDKKRAITQTSFIH